MIELLKQALKAFEVATTPLAKDRQEVLEAVKAIKQAIAELESQEPVATVTSETGADITMSWWHEPALPMGTKLFTHPPQEQQSCDKRTWVGLTDSQRKEIERQSVYVDGAIRITEAKLKEMNT